MYNKKKVSILLLSVISIFLFLGTTFLASININLRFILGGVIYFLGAFFLLKFYKFNVLSRMNIFLIILSPLLLLFLYFNILKFKSTFISFPATFFNLCCIYFAYLTYKTKKYYFLIILLAIGYFVYNYQYLLFNKIRYGTFSESVTIKQQITGLQFANGIEKDFKNIKKAYILDFWFSKCRPCFELFPKINEVALNIDTTKFEIYTVNIPIDMEKRENNYSLLEKYNYRFNQLFAENDSIPKSLNITSYPTTIIIKGGVIVFRGDFKNAIDYAKK